MFQPIKLTCHKVVIQQQLYFTALWYSVLANLWLNGVCETTPTVWVAGWQTATCNHKYNTAGQVNSTFRTCMVWQVVHNHVSYH